MGAGREKWHASDGSCCASSRMHWLDPVILGVTYVENLLAAHVMLAASVRAMLQQHYNATVDSEEFVAQAAFEIESLLMDDGGD